MFTKNIDKAIMISDAMESGTIQINAAPARGPDHFPFQVLHFLPTSRDMFEKLVIACKRCYLRSIYCLILDSCSCCFPVVDQEMLSMSCCVGIYGCLLIHPNFVPQTLTLKCELKRDGLVIVHQ